MNNSPEDAPEQISQPEKNDGAMVASREALRPYNLQRSVSRMNAFIRAYEKNFGNISLTCQEIGISRWTYYRWINGTASIHRRFQKKIFKILPGERRLDAAEYTIDRHLADGSLTAAMFLLNNLGGKRGYTAAANGKGRDDRPAAATSGEIAAVRAYQLWLEDHPQAAESEKRRWLERFADRCGVTPVDVVRALKIQEVTESIQ